MQYSQILPAAGSLSSKPPSRFCTTRHLKNNSMAAISASFGAAIRRAAPVHLRVARPRSLTTTVKATKEVIATDKSAAALGPYSQAIKVRKPFFNPSLSSPPLLTSSSTPHSPIPPHTHAWSRTQAGNTLYVSGQIGLTPEMVFAGDTIEARGKKASTSNSTPQLF